MVEAMSRGKTLRSPERKRRGPPSWLTVLVALAVVGAVYWLQGPADSPWKNPDKIPSVVGGAGDKSDSSVPDSKEPNSADEEQSPQGAAAGEGAESTGAEGASKSSGANEGATGSSTTDSSDSTAAARSSQGGDSIAAVGATAKTASTATTGEKGSPGAKSAKTTKPKKLSPVVKGMKIRDLSGNVVYEGDVDLRETLKRIDGGQRFKEFPNDGSIFQNREKRLPAKEREYYQEWVHRTPGLSGPGPQRVVTGRAGEAYYTPDHYSRFIKVR
jgi:ribonuclease T1